MTLLILRPGERSVVAFTPSATAEYPLDSILIVPYQQDQLRFVASAVKHVRRGPWVSVVVGLARSELPIAHLEELAIGLHLATTPLVADGRIDAELIRAAVRERGAPTIERFSAWCGRRFDTSIEPIMGRVLAGTGISRSEARALSGFGRLGPPQWRALFLITRIHGASWRRRHSLEHLAEHYGTTRKTSWEWMKRLLGLSWSQTIAMAGWEAIVELAIRRAQTAI